MAIIGITTDNKPIVNGVSKLYFEGGLPLSFIFDVIKKHNFVVSWKHLYKEMRDNGMSHERILHLLNEHIFESYGKEYRDIVIKTIQNEQQSDTSKCV